MKRFKTKHFSKWAKKAAISDSELLKALKELEKGLYAADLGGYLFKVRIARESKGKSSGYRTLIAYKAEQRQIYLYGFAKNEKENISKNELDAFKKLAKDFMNLSDMQIRKTKKLGILISLE